MDNPWNNINQPSKDVAARRIDHTHPFDLFWAIDYSGHYLFIFEFSPENNLKKISLPNLVGIQTVYAPANNVIAKDRLILLLNEQNNWELFLSLCNDLVQVTRNSENSSDAFISILGRLDHWQEFLKNIREGILSEEKILGLIGELLFIRNYLIPTFGAGQSIKFWQGPEGFSQDFNVNECAIEVKCQSAAKSSYVKISSAEQLCPQLPEIYLFVATLGKTSPETTNAINLPTLTDQIKGAIKSATSIQMERFMDLLHLVGYIDSDRYLEFSYVLISERMFLVADDFPRICSKDLPRGIANISYSINLSECTKFEKQPDWMRIIK